MRRAVATLCVSVVLLAACSGDDTTRLAIEPTTTEAPRPTTTRATTTTTAPTTTTTELTYISSGYNVSTVGVGAVVFGIKKAEAERRWESGFVGFGSASCYIVTPERGPEGLEFTIKNGRVERVDITNPGVRTKSGAGVGWTEQQVRERFGASIKERTTDGVRELVFVPSDEKNKNYRIVFVSDGETITKFRSGKIPEVETLDACG